jgi:hypothetical protein
MSARAFLALVLASNLSAACGDDESAGGGGADDGGGGSGGVNANGGAGGQAADPATLESVNAPTETTIVIEVGGAFIAGHPSAPSMYVIESDVGALAVGEVTFDAEAGQILLTTAKQKLGVEYSLEIKAPGNELDLESAKFLSADTATFWATDFTDFSDYQVVARRELVGEHVVVYATDDAIDANDLAETVSFFDETIFPIETESLHPAPDLDGNGKILLLGLDGGGYYGGYFSPLNSIPSDLAEMYGYHSNEMEMLYVSVPDAGYNYLPLQIVAHEFSHLLYNEEHPFGEEDWSWHNEGMAECAVHLVSGAANDYAMAVYFDPAGADLAAGQSLVIWEYGNYNQYAQSYMFLTYAASQLGGVSAYTTLFDQSGDPSDLSTFFQTELARGFNDVQLDFLTAVWLGEPTGPYGFAGMLSVPGDPPQAPGNGASLLPFTGVFLDEQGADLTFSGAGADVVHRAIRGDGTVDDESPFDATGGVVVALNTSLDAESTTPQPSGVTPLPAPRRPAASSTLSEWKTWMHPPPVKPANRRALEAWRAHVHGF